MPQKHRSTKSRFGLALRTIALTLSVSFLLSDVSHAAPGLAFNFLSRDLVSDPSLLKLPSEFARIDEIHRAKGGSKLLIHIQDAHTNFSAQENIAKVLEELITRYKVNTVFVEGGTQDDSLSFVRPLAPKATRERVAKKYLLAGQIKGVEYLDLSSDHTFGVWGVEDKALYDKNLKTYARLAAKREEILAYIAEIQKRTSALKCRIFPKELRVFDDCAEKFTKKQNDFSEYHALLLETATQAGVNLFGYPNFLSLKELKSSEANIDFKKANEEQTALLETLFKDPAEREEALALLSGEISKLRSYDLTPGFFYEALIQRAEKAGLKKETYQNLAKYTDYLKKYSGVDAKELFKEIKSLEHEIYRTTLTDEAAYYLHEISDYLSLLRSLHSLQISSKDFDAYSQYRGDVRFETVVLLAFLNKRLYDLGNAADVAKFLPVLDDNRKDAEDFYHTNEDRDKAFLEKSLSRMEKNKINVAVLISGGYHTENLTKLMKEKNVSYAVVTPHISQETNIKRYEEILLGQLGPDNPLAKKIVSNKAESLAEWVLAGRPSDLVTVIEDIAPQIKLDIKPQGGEDFRNRLANYLGEVHSTNAARLPTARMKYNSYVYSNASWPFVDGESPKRAWVHRNLLEIAQRYVAFSSLEPLFRHITSDDPLEINRMIKGGKPIPGIDAGLLLSLRARATKLYDDKDWTEEGRLQHYVTSLVGMVNQVQDPKKREGLIQYIVSASVDPGHPDVFANGNAARLADGRGDRRDFLGKVAAGFVAAMVPVPELVSQAQDAKTKASATRGFPASLQIVRAPINITNKYQEKDNPGLFRRIPEDFVAKAGDIGDNHLVFALEPEKPAEFKGFDVQIRSEKDGRETDYLLKFRKDGEDWFVEGPNGQETKAALKEYKKGRFAGRFTVAIPGAEIIKFFGGVDAPLSRLDVKFGKSSGNLVSETVKKKPIVFIANASDKKLTPATDGHPKKWIEADKEPLNITDRYTDQSGFYVFASVDPQDNDFVFILEPKDIPKFAGFAVKISGNDKNGTPKKFEVVFEDDGEGWVAKGPGVAPTKATLGLLGDGRIEAAIPGSEVKAFFGDGATLNRFDVAHGKAYGNVETETLKGKPTVRLAKPSAARLTAGVEEEPVRGMGAILARFELSQIDNPGLVAERLNIQETPSNVEAKFLGNVIVVRAADGRVGIFYNKNNHLEFVHEVAFKPLNIELGIYRSEQGESYRVFVVGTSKRNDERIVDILELVGDTLLNGFRPGVVIVPGTLKIEDPTFSFVDPSSGKERVFSLWAPVEITSVDAPAIKAAARLPLPTGQAGAGKAGLPNLRISNPSGKLIVVSGSKFDLTNWIRDLRKSVPFETRVATATKPEDIKNGSLGSTDSFTIGDPSFVLVLGDGHIVLVRDANGYSQEWQEYFKDQVTAPIAAARAARSQGRVLLAMEDPLVLQMAKIAMGQIPLDKVRSQFESLREGDLIVARNGGAGGDVSGLFFVVGVNLVEQTVDLGVLRTDQPGGVPFEFLAGLRAADLEEMLRPYGSSWANNRFVKADDRDAFTQSTLELIGLFDVSPELLSPEGLDAPKPTFDDALKLISRLETAGYHLTMTTAPSDSGLILYFNYDVIYPNGSRSPSQTSLFKFIYNYLTPKPQIQILRSNPERTGFTSFAEFERTPGVNETEFDALQRRLEARAAAAPPLAAEASGPVSVIDAARLTIKKTDVNSLNKGDSFKIGARSEFKITGIDSKGIDLLYTQKGESGSSRPLRINKGRNLKDSKHDITIHLSALRSADIDLKIEAPESMIVTRSALEPETRLPFGAHVRVSGSDAFVSITLSGHRIVFDLPFSLPPTLKGHDLENAIRERLSEVFKPDSVKKVKESEVTAAVKEVALGLGAQPKLLRTGSVGPSLVDSDSASFIDVSGLSDLENADGSSGARLTLQASINSERSPRRPSTQFIRPEVSSQEPTSAPLDVKGLRTLAVGLVGANPSIFGTNPILIPIGGEGVAVVGGAPAQGAIIRARRFSGAFQLSANRFDITGNRLVIDEKPVELKSISTGELVAGVRQERRLAETAAAQVESVSVRAASSAKAVELEAELDLDAVARNSVPQISELAKLPLLGNGRDSSARNRLGRGIAQLAEMVPAGSFGAFVLPASVVEGSAGFKETVTLMNRIFKSQNIGLVLSITYHAGELSTREIQKLETLSTDNIKVLAQQVISDDRTPETVLSGIETAGIRDLKFLVLGANLNDLMTDRLGYVRWRQQSLDVPQSLRDNTQFLGIESFGAEDVFSGSGLLVGALSIVFEYFHISTALLPRLEVRRTSWGTYYVLSPISDAQLAAALLSKRFSESSA